MMKNGFGEPTFYFLYHQISYLLNEIDININTGPVLDLRRSKSSNVIGDRSYSSLARNVSTIGDFAIREFNKGKIGTVIKHIPGHGLSKVDSHNKKPFINVEVKKGSLGVRNFMKLLNK